METKTFTEVRRMTDSEARAYLEQIRWPDGIPTCPHCGVVGEATALKGTAHREGVWKCRACRKQFTVTVGTIFQGSHIPLGQWITAFYIVIASKKAVSALQLQRMLGLGSYKSAWHMAHRIRTALANSPEDGPLMGRVECDEVYVGGKPRRLANTKRPGGVLGYRPTTKVPVLVLVERGGKARATMAPRANAACASLNVERFVSPTAHLNTDQSAIYKRLRKSWPGGASVINHMERYADGANHINSAESYNALVRRCVMGAWHHISPKHMQKYLNEISFRWSHRKATDSERAVTALRQGDGVRLVYRQG
jgi:transposase-like protein